MDSSFREPGSDTQQEYKRFSVTRSILERITTWLAGLVRLTQEEREEAGIHLDRPGHE